MKFIIPNYCPADTFVDNVSFTLKKMGHQVLTMPAVSNRWNNSGFNRVLKATKEKLVSNYIPDQEVWLLKNIKSFNPDVVLTLTQPLSESTLFELKKENIQTAVWWGDPPANMKGAGLLAKGWDIVFIKDPNAVIKLKRVGINAELLHEAMNPAWHKPLSKRSNDHIAVAGSVYNYRHFIVRKLLEEKISVGLYGQYPPIWADKKVKAIHSGKFITKEEKSKVFGAALGCLNTTSMAEGNSLNCRAFEIAGARGLHIMENRPIIPECFEPGKEVIVFDTFDELISIIKEFDSNNKKAEEIREAGYQRAIKEHTYEKRLVHIIDKLNELK